MRGRRVVFLVTLTPLTILVIVGIWTQIIPQYEAKGEVQIRPIIPILAFRTNDNGPIPFYESFVNTQVAIMRSPDVLNRVLEQPDVRQTKWFREPSKSLVKWLTGQTGSTMERLKHALLVQPRRRTEIVDVSFTCGRAEDAAVVVNAVLDQYMKYINETANRRADELDRARDRLYSELKAEISDLEMIVNKLHQELGTTTPQERISAKRLRLDEMEACIEELTRDIVILKSRLNIIDSNEPQMVPQTGRLPYHLDLVWDTLNSIIRTIRNQMAISRLDPNHPDMIQLTKYLAFVEESLRQREAQLEMQWRQPGAVIPTVPSAPSAPELAGGLMSLRQQLALAEKQKRLLEEQYQKDKRDFEDLFERAQNLERYNITLREKREVFDQVRQIREQKGPSQVLTRAVAPSEPLTDPRILYTAIALGLYVIIGGCIAASTRKAKGGVDSEKALRQSSSSS